MIGQTISHYKILEKIGEGGMGVVYKAEDTTLKRHVALKFPSEHILADEAKKARFILEARASAALDHPNICTLYEIDEVEGTTFISMAYIDGQNLAQRIESGPLNLDKMFNISLQIAHGLNAAHEKGIVHRDIKSANIMITQNGQVKIMDFGLAKLTGETSLTGLTQNGSMMGTVAYMSPEQAKGEPVDYRTDIWSLGVVMYEMLAGELPFKGGTGHAAIHSILYEEPKRLGEIRRDVPPSLDQIVSKMMQKNPSSRPADMKAVIAYMESFSLKSRLSKEQVVSKRAQLTTIMLDTVSKMIQKSPPSRSSDTNAVISDLESISSKSSLSKEQVVPKPIRLTTIIAIVAILISVGILTLLNQKPWAAKEKNLSSIAVLPFMNISADPNQEYFCDGIAEELINALTQIGDLRVIARTSAFSYKGKDVTVREIGNQLNVETVLEGSVRKAEDRLRITAQLIDASTGLHLWSEQYDRTVGDALVIQDEIASAIVARLKPRLLGEISRKLTKRQSVDVKAYNLYLSGLFFWNKRNEANLKKAIEFFERAIEEDADYALAYAGMASSYILLPYYGPVSPREAYAKATTAALRALEINETLAEAHTVLGYINMVYDWNWNSADRHFKLALKSNPRYATAHNWYAEALIYRGRFEEAISEIEQALELDPVSVSVNRDLGWIYSHAGQFDRAIVALKKAIEMEPSMALAHSNLGFAYLGKSMYEEALIEFQREREISGTWPGIGIAYIYLQTGKREEAQKILDDLLERSQNEYVSPFLLARFHFLLGKNDEGFRFMDQAYEEHDHRLCQAKIIPLIGDIRSDPRYIALLRKLNLIE